MKTPKSFGWAGTVLFVNLTDGMIKKSQQPPINRINSSAGLVCAAKSIGIWIALVLNRLLVPTMHSWFRLGR